MRKPAKQVDTLEEKIQLVAERACVHCGTIRCTRCHANTIVGYILMGSDDFFCVNCWDDPEFSTPETARTGHLTAIASNGDHLRLREMNVSWEGDNREE